jgi:K+-sensing histidine kinase KdpD
MQINNARRWALRGPRRWILAAAALTIAAGVRVLLHPLLGPIMPGTAFLIAALLVEYFCGLGPAFLVMLCGLYIADYLFVPPYRQIEVFDQADVELLVSYPLITLLVIPLIERLRRAQYRAELLTAVAQSRYEMLLRHDNERVLARRATDEMHRMLHHVAQHSRSLILIQALENKPFMQPGPPARPVVGIAPGPRHADVHPDDIARISSGLLPGRHRIRFKAGEHSWKPVDCVCEVFRTDTGDFLVLRTGV